MRCCITNITGGEVGCVENAIRSHERVENMLRRALDVVFDEERSRKRVENSAKNYSLLLRDEMTSLKREYQSLWYDKSQRHKQKAAI